MTFVHSLNSRILLNEDHISGSITGYSTEFKRDLGPVTTILDTGARFVPGLIDGSVTLNGLFNSAAGDLYEEISQIIGTDNSALVTVFPEGFTIGKPAFIAVTDLSEWEIPATVTDPVALTITGQPDDGVDWGVSLHALGAETADNTATSVDNAASSAGGGVATLHVTAYSGLTNVAFKVQHSTDNSSWSDLIAFTSVTAVTSERKTVTGTVNRYVRAFWDVTGSGSATFQMAFARR